MAVSALKDLHECPLRRGAAEEGGLEALQEELRAAREDAAAAMEHMKQFQALATSSDQSLKDMEVGPTPRLPHRSFNKFG